MRAILAAALIVLVTTGFSWLERWAAPDARLVDEHWQRRGTMTSAVVDHAPWAAFLDAHLVVDPQGVHRLRYAAVGPADRRTLDAYVARLAATEVTALDRETQLAFWLNLYNALTVSAVLDAYPVASIRDIDGVWRAKRVRVEGRALSLDDIEHGIVRPIFADPRIHYAFNCAAVGCPNLQAEPFAAARLDAQLDAAAREYVNDPRGVTVTTGGEVVLSSIYNWFAEDFGDGEDVVLAHIAAFAEPSLAARLAAADGIDGFAYDWALNDADRDSRG